MSALNTSSTANVSTSSPSDHAKCVSFGQDFINAFLDASFAEDKIHVVVFLAVVCALGTTGNLLVILVNAPRKDKSSATIFVLTLAIVDLFICAVKIPLRIAEIQHVTYTSTVWCKSSPYFTIASLLSSLFLLTAIAVDRYRAVAQPVRYRVSRNRSVPVVCVLSVLAGCLVAVPAVLLQDEVHGIPVGPACETVSLCASVGSVLHGRIFFGVTATVFFSCVLAIFVLYALVYKHVMDLVHPLPRGASVWAALQHRLPKPGGSDAPLPSGLSTAPQDAPLPSGLSTAPPEAPLPSGPCIANSNRQASHTETHPSENSSPQPEPEVTPPPHPDPGWRRCRLSAVQRQYRVAKLLLLITAVFILSWLPYWVISLYDTDKPSWLLPQSAAVKRTVVFFSNVYFINNAANPLIYTFVQKDFRDRLAKLFRCNRN